MSKTLSHLEEVLPSLTSGSRRQLAHLYYNSQKINIYLLAKVFLLNPVLVCVCAVLSAHAPDERVVSRSES